MNRDLIRNAWDRARAHFQTTTAQDIGVVFGARVGGAALGLLFHILLARLTGAASYGAYAFAAAWLKILSMVAGLGLPEAVVRFLPAYRERNQWSRISALLRQSRFRIGTTSAFIALAGTVATIGWIGANAGWSLELIQENAMSSAFVVGLWCLPIVAMVRFSTQVCRASNQIAAAYALPRLGRPSLMILALLLYAGTSTSALPGSGAVLLLGLSAIPVWLIQRRISSSSLSTQSPKRDSEEPFDTTRWHRVATPLLLVSGFTILIQQTDLIVVGFLMGAEPSGVYKAAVALAKPAGFVLTAINAVVAPRFSELYASGEFSKLRSLARTLAPWLFWPTAIVAVGIGLLGPLLLTVFGSEFAGAYLPLVILLLSHVLNAGAGSVGYLLNMTGHHLHTARVYGIVALINVVLNTVGIWGFGLLGAATATAISTLIWNVWLYFIVRDHLKIDPSIVSSVRGSLQV